MARAPRKFRARCRVGHNSPAAAAVGSRSSPSCPVPAVDVCIEGSRRMILALATFGREARGSLKREHKRDREKKGERKRVQERTASKNWSPTAKGERGGRQKLSSCFILHSQTFLCRRWRKSALYMGGMPFTLLEDYMHI